MREDYEKFKALNAEILVIGPENAEDFRKYWEKEKLPFIGLADPEHNVLNLCGQEVRLLKLGRMPAQFMIDQHGKIRFVHYSGSMMDIPTNEELLKVLNS